MNIFYQLLKDSPLFNLSLADKELFHSNFLAWLSEKSETRPLFIHCIKQLSKQKIGLWVNDFEQNPGSYIIKREFNNFDLCILKRVNQSNKNGKPKGELLLPVLVLENKNKSIPDQKQLQEYEGKVRKIYGAQYNPNCITYILLSLATIFPDKTKISQQGIWSICSYDQLANALSSALSSFPTINPYYNQLIIDYKTFISNLHRVSCEWLNIDTYRIPDDEWEQLKECRIHDICDKIRCCKFISEFEKMYSIKLTQFYSQGAGFYWWKDLGNGISIQIQIQNGQYRHAIIENGNIKNKIGKNYSQRNQKGQQLISSVCIPPFLNAPNAFINNQKVLDNGIYPIGNSFNIYEKSGANGYIFLYQYKKIKNDAKVQDLMDYLYNDIIRY